MLHTTDPTDETLQECRKLNPILPTGRFSSSTDDFLNLIFWCLPIPELSITENPFHPTIVNRVIDLLSPDVHQDVFGKYVGAAERNAVLQRFKNAYKLIQMSAETEQQFLQVFAHRKQKIFALLFEGPAVVYIRDMYAYISQLKNLNSIGTPSPEPDDDGEIPCIGQVLTFRQPSQIPDRIAIIRN